MNKSLMRDGWFHRKGNKRINCLMNMYGNKSGGLWFISTAWRDKGGFPPACSRSFRKAIRLALERPTGPAPPCITFKVQV